MTSKRPRLFYGWLIVFVSAVGLFLGAPLMVFSFSVFFKSLVADFHASRAAVSFAFSLFNFVGALWLPATGFLIDRLGAKRVILVSTLLYGAGLCVPLGGQRLVAAVSSIRCTGNRNGQRPRTGSLRSRHLTLVQSSPRTRTGGVDDGNRNRLHCGPHARPAPHHRIRLAHRLRDLRRRHPAAAPPFITALLQNDPEQRRLLPGRRRKKFSSPHLPPQDKQGLTWHEIWHSPTFWIMICIFSPRRRERARSLLHLSAILTDRGVTPERAAIATSLVGAAVIVGRLGSGYLLDHFFAPRVAILFYGATALGMAILCAGNAGNIALVASFLIGLGIGAEIETMGYMISRYFGLASFGTAYGHAFGAYMLSGSVGVLLMGAGYDRFHSYTVPLAVFCGAILVTLILLTRLGPYRYGIEAETNQPMKPLEIPSGA